MNKSKVLRNFPNQPFPLTIKRAKGIYLFTKNGRRIMDLTGGCNSHAIIGYCHPQVIKALNKQAEKFSKGPTNAYKSVKKLLSESFNNGLESQMEIESIHISNNAETKDGIEGLTAFSEKRKPNFNE